MPQIVWEEFNSEPAPNFIEVYGDWLYHGGYVEGPAKPGLQNVASNLQYTQHHFPAYYEAKIWVKPSGAPYEQSDAMLAWHNQNDSGPWGLWSFGIRGGFDANNNRVLTALFYVSNTVIGRQATFAQLGIPEPVSRATAVRFGLHVHLNASGHPACTAYINGEYFSGPNAQSGQIMTGYRGSLVNRASDLYNPDPVGYFEYFYAHDSLVFPSAAPTTRWSVGSIGF